MTKQEAAKVLDDAIQAADRKLYHVQAIAKDVRVVRSAEKQREADYRAAFAVYDAVPS